MKNKKRLYLICSLVGIVLPYWYWIAWLMDNGLDVSAFFATMAANPISMFAWMDIAVTATVLLAYMVIEHRKTPVRGMHWAVIGTVCIGPSFGLPFFLYLKEAGKGV